MLKRFFNQSSSSITSAAIIIGAAAFTSRLLGIVRDRILAGQFGAGTTLDVYYAAFRIPDLVYNFIVLGALSAGFIPVFIRVWKKSESEAWRLASGVLNILIISLLVISGVLFVFAPQLTALITPGFSPDAQALTSSLTRIMFLSPLLLGISAIWGGILQSLKKFFVFSLAPVLYNIGIMIGALWFVPRLGVAGLAWGVVLGAGLHMIIQLPAVITSGFRYHWDWRVRGTGVGEIIVLMVPRTLGLVVSQLNIVVMTMIASTLTIGSVAVFNFANNLQSFILGIFGISFAIAAFPALSSAADHADPREFIKHFSQTARQILFFVIPLSTLFLLLRAQITRVVLGSGAFDWADTIATADTLAFFVLSLFAQGLIPLLVRGFFAQKNTATPFIIGLLSAGVNIAAAIWLAPLLGVAGLALAFSIGSVVNLILLWVTLRMKVGSLDEAVIVWSTAKISLATFAMALVIQGLKFVVEPVTGTTTFWGIFSQGLVAGLVGLAVFTVVSVAVKSDEMMTFLSAFGRKFFRRNKATVEQLENDL